MKQPNGFAAARDVCRDARVASDQPLLLRTLQEMDS